jgi:SAM-dependent methyltransferase
MLLFFPVHRLLVGLWPSAAWKLAQVAERRHWRLAMGPTSGERITNRAAIRARNWAVYRETFGPLFEVPRDVVVEVGCGPAGPISVVPARWRVGIDPSLPTFNAAVKLSHDPVCYVAARGEAIPLRNGVADAVICVNVLDHVPRPLGILREIERVLRPDGYLFLNVDVDRPRRSTVDYVLHPGRMPAVRILAALSAGFEVMCSRTGPGPRNPASNSLTVVARRRRWIEGCAPRPERNWHVWGAAGKA